MSGVPTIAADIGGLPEVVKPGITGTLVPSRDSHRLAEAILDLRQNYKAALQTAALGKRLISEMFDPPRCAKEVFDIYKHILAGAPRPSEFSADEFLDQQPSAYAMSAS
jgi:glycosyltransferase involved in cell wall biosynthesis